MRVNINEYLLPYSGSVLNTFCVLLYQVFLATLRRYVCHPYFTDGKLMLSNLPKVVQLVSREIRI